uniref:Nucleoprotein n=1 Tax=Zhangye Rhabd tick virus 1 TaxID=2972340 RepID=A0A9E7V2I7_9RHAB|nr:MAG: nucleocapsid [Zhangye Rhabd tick virus 1]
MSGRKQFEVKKGDRAFNFRSKNDKKESVKAHEIVWEDISGVDELQKYMNNPDKEKPKVMIVQDSRVTVPLLDLVNGGLRACSLDGNIAAAFLHEQAANFKQVLDEDLLFDEIVIGKKAETITPVSFLNVEQVQAQFPQLKLGTVAPTLFSPEVAVFLIGYCHRMASAGTLATTEYLNALAERASNMLRVFPYYAEPAELKNILAAGPSIGNEFMACKSASTMIAAYDAFFRTFDQHKYSSVTMGTLQSFCRDYTVFIDLKFMTDITSMEFGDWAQWIWVPEIHGEMHNLAQIVGLGKMKRSYFPYLRSMSVITRSPLAATVSPHLHTFIHAVGVLRGERRSFTARMVSGGIHYLIFKNVRVFMMALGYRTDIFRMGVFVDEKDEEETKKQEEAAKRLMMISSATAGQQPKLFSARHWLAYAVTFPRLKMPGSMDACKVVLDCITDIRPGTIVEQMKVEIQETMAAPGT